MFLAYLFDVYILSASNLKLNRQIFCSIPHEDPVILITYPSSDSLAMYFTLSTVLLAATAYASPLLELRQSTCPSGAGITAARAAQVKAAFQRDRIIPDTVPDINPKVELTVKYGNRNENLGNEFSVPGTSSSSNRPISPPSSL